LENAVLIVEIHFFKVKVKLPMTEMKTLNKDVQEMNGLRMKRFNFKNGEEDQIHT
jgi:hypothetical protein